MLGPRVGTLDWARATGGRLRWTDRARLMAEALLVRINGLRRSGGRPLLDVEVATLPIPDTEICGAAERFLRTSSEPWLANHCLRTYLWGAIVGTGEKRGFDAEVLCLASLLHDVGLTTLGGSALPAECFAVAGANNADAFLALADEGGERRHRVAEAIALHMNVRVTPAQGVEAYLLHEGAALDVTGLRFAEIPPSAATDVLSRHPRLAIKEEIAKAMKRESRIRPHSRAAFLCRLGFIGMIRRAPFAS